jgi:hypothetical protein
VASRVVVHVMKAVFVHDHCFAVTSEGTVYTTGKLNYDAWARYLKVFESLTVVARHREVSTEAASALREAGGERVVFRFVPNVKGSIRGLMDLPAVGRALREEMERADALIARRMHRPHAMEAVGDT